MALDGGAADVSPGPERHRDWFQHLRSIVDNGAMVVTGMEDGLGWMVDESFPASDSRQRYAHRLVELGRYRQGFAVGAFFGWLGRAPRARDETADGEWSVVSHVADRVRVADGQSGEHIDIDAESMSSSAAARLLRSVAEELRREPTTRIDIVVHADHLTLCLGDDVIVHLHPRHPCPRTAAHVLRHCLGPTASGLRLRTADQ